MYVRERLVRIREEERPRKDIGETEKRDRRIEETVLVREKEIEGVMES